MLTDSSSLPYSEPVGWTSRALIADPTLPHQLQLRNIPGNTKILVRCNCGELMGYCDPVTGNAAVMYDTHLAELENDCGMSLALDRPNDRRIR